MAFKVGWFGGEFDRRPDRSEAPTVPLCLLSVGAVLIYPHWFCSCCLLLPDGFLQVMAALLDGHGTETCCLHSRCGCCWCCESTEATVTDHQAESRPTRDVHPVLAQCWASVEDGGPSLSRHWVNVSCLPRYAGPMVASVADVSPRLCQQKAHVLFLLGSNDKPRKRERVIWYWFNVGPVD